MKPRQLYTAAKHADADACVPWPFANDYGYPIYTVAGRKVRGHRQMCIETHGEPTGEKTHAAHTCGVRKCINPHHIRWATPVENNADKKLHGTHQALEKNPNAKLTAQTVAAIRADSGTLKQLSDKYNTHFSNISLIRRGKAW